MGKSDLCVRIAKYFEYFKYLYAREIPLWLEGSESNLKLVEKFISVVCFISRTYLQSYNIPVSLSRNKGEIFPWRNNKVQIQVLTVKGIWTQKFCISFTWRLHFQESKIKKFHGDSTAQRLISLEILLATPLKIRI
jgi:hypothetical protein